ncbi:hypothetical protein Esti_001022 [Eimeria stiedai]
MAVSVNLRRPTTAVEGLGRRFMSFYMLDLASKAVGQPWQQAAVRLGVPSPEVAYAKNALGRARLISSLFRVQVVEGDLLHCFPLTEQDVDETALDLDFESPQLMEVH